MTLTVTSSGHVDHLTEYEIVALAFVQQGFDPRDLAEGFIAFWLQQHKNVDEILAIAGLQPLRKTA